MINVRINKIDNRKTREKISKIKTPSWGTEISAEQDLTRWKLPSGGQVEGGWLWYILYHQYLLYICKQARVRGPGILTCSTRGWWKMRPGSVFNKVYLNICFKNKASKCWPALDVLASDCKSSETKSMTKYLNSYQS